MAPGDEGPPKIGSSVHGVDEAKILSRVSTYIHIGNAISHADKRLRREQHKTYRFPWIISRSANAAADVIYVWHR